MWVQNINNKKVARSQQRRQAVPSPPPIRPREEINTAYQQCFRLLEQQKNMTRKYDKLDGFNARCVNSSILGSSSSSSSSSGQLVVNMKRKRGRVSYLVWSATLVMLASVVGVNGQYNSYKDQTSGDQQQNKNRYHQEQHQTSQDYPARSSYSEHAFRNQEQSLDHLEAADTFDQDGAYIRQFDQVGFVSRGQRDLNLAAESSNSILVDDEGAQHNRPPHTQSSFMSASTTPAATTITEPIRLGEEQVESASTSYYLSYKPPVTLSQLDDSEGEEISSTVLSVIDANHTAAVLGEKEQNSIVILKLESAIEIYHQRLRLLEQFVKVSTQKLYTMVKRVSDLEKCDCHIGCSWNNTRYSDGYTWQKDCDICTCNRGSVSCKHVICEPSPCQELHHVQGRCCPVCYKTCKFNDITLKHGHKTIMSINNDTCKECICLDGRIKCHQVELIISKVPLVPAGGAENRRKLDDELSAMSGSSNQSTTDHRVHNSYHSHYSSSSSSSSNNNNEFDHQKHLLCPPISCPPEDRFHLVNDCCTYCKNFDFCFHRGHQCHEHAHCININNSFSCVCDNGFTGNGRYCHDIDECQDDSMNNCNKTNSICMNTQGSFRCQCLPGYTTTTSANKQLPAPSMSSQLDNNNHNSSTIDEAGQVTSQEQLSSQQTTGNLTSGGECLDIDECSRRDLNNCDINARCINKIGSFKCRCNRGYLGNGLECHKWITSATNVANYRHNHRKRKKKLQQQQQQQQSANNVFVNGVASSNFSPGHLGDELDNSIRATATATTSLDTSSRHFKLPVLKPIDEDDDYDDTDDEDEEDVDDDDELDDELDDDQSTNYITKVVDVLKQQQKISRQRVCHSKEAGFKQGTSLSDNDAAAGCNSDSDTGGDNLKESLAKGTNTQYLPLIKSESDSIGGEPDRVDSLRGPVISLHGSALQHNTDNQRHISSSFNNTASAMFLSAGAMATSSTLNTRTMFQQPRPKTITSTTTTTTTTLATQSVTQQLSDQIITTTMATTSEQLQSTSDYLLTSTEIKSIETNNNNNNNNKHLASLTTATIKTNDLNRKGPTTMGQSWQASDHTQATSNNKKAFSQYKKGTIITSAGSSPSKTLRSQARSGYSSSSASSSTSIQYHVSNVYNLFINYQLYKIIVSSQSLLFFLTCFTAIIYISTESHH